MQSLRAQYTLRVPPPDPPDIPIILVHDHTDEEDVFTILYVNGDNELDFMSIYKSIKCLLKHPKCSHRLSGDHWPCSACSEAFSATFWEGASRLLDYFADFLIHDNGYMASLWFYLLDIWQDSRTWFPCDAVLASPSLRPVSQAELTAARDFESNFKATLELMNTVLYGTEGAKSPKEELVHTPSGDVTTSAGWCNTGPWESGLKPWEQFLRNGSPGVVGFGEDADSGSVRYVPMPAIGIIKRHTERARRLAAQLNPSPEFLNAFDQNSLQFPQSTQAGPHTYTSLDNVTMTYRLVNGAPPIIRYPGYGDPNHLCSKPTLTLLDEFVARCKDVKAYEPVSGDGTEDDGLDDIGAFDMWAVS